jgi:hypothetical protein
MNRLRSRILNAWLPMLAAFGMALFASEASAALTLSPAKVTVAVGSRAATQISGASGQIQVESKNTSITTVSLSNVTTTSATLTVYGVSAGSATVYVRDARTANISLPATVVNSLAVSPTSLSLAVGALGKLTASNYSGTVTATAANTSVATVSVSANVVTVRGIAPGSTLVSVRDSRATVNVPVTVTSSTTTTAKYSLIAWNDLGMHCVDGKDYSVFSILPPFNNLHAQLVNASTGKAVTSGVTLTYQSVADPAGSINTSSASKTNFWTWVQTVYGAPLASDVGLTGNYTPSLTPRPMTLDATNGWFEAGGLPITPYDDNGIKHRKGARHHFDGAACE